MRLPHMDTRLFRIVRFVMMYVIVITMFTAPTWFFVFGLLALFVLVIRPLTAYLSPVFLWSLMGTMLVFGAINFAHFYSQFPDRYPHEVMAFTTRFIDEIQEGNIEEARALTKMRIPYYGTEEGFANTASKLPSTELELEALVYVGSVSEGYTRYAIYLLNEDSQVKIEVGHPLDGPKALWVQSLHILPMSEYVKPPSTFWMRRERDLK